MCAAHWPAVQALSASCNLEGHAGLRGCSKLAVSLAICMGKGPPGFVADEDLQRVFGSMLSCVPQVRQSVAPMLLGCTPKLRVLG